jgi:hypothetical protein
VLSLLSSSFIKLIKCVSSSLPIGLSSEIKSILIFFISEIFFGEKLLPVPPSACDNSSIVGGLPHFSSNSRSFFLTIFMFSII